MNRRGGSVLILAVWVLFFLTALAVAVGSQVGAMLTLAGFVRDHVALRALGQAAAMQSAAVISGQTNTWDGVTDDSWTRDAAAFTVKGLPGGTARIGFIVRDERSAVTNTTGVIGESGRINLNKASEALLKYYFHVAGDLPLVDGKAADLAKAVRARVGARPAPSTGAPGAGYDADGSSASGPFALVEELRGVSGMTPDLFERLAPGLTVFGDGLINVNTASAMVLESVALAGIDEPRLAAAATALAARIVRFREDGHAFTDPESEAMKATFYAAQNVPSEEKQCFERMTGRLTVASTHFRGITYVQFDDATRETAAQEFVFDNREKRFVYWREF